MHRDSRRLLGTRQLTFESEAREYRSFAPRTMHYNRIEATTGWSPVITQRRHKPETGFHVKHKGLRTPRHYA